MTRRRLMALCFAVGSTGFLVGPLPGYANLVGDSADNVTTYEAMHTAVTSSEYKCST
jgi:hypothetical protein